MNVARGEMTSSEGGVSRAARIAAALHVALGVGFGAGAVLSLLHLDRTGELPMTPFGFRALSGPFERLGWPAFKLLGWILVTVSALDIIAGRWLWQGRRRGAALAWVTNPIAFLLSVGFALPFLLIGVPIRAALLAVGRRRPRAVDRSDTIRP
jgi:hypothetical protein